MELVSDRSVESTLWVSSAVEAVVVEAVLAPGKSLTWLLFVTGSLLNDIGAFPSMKQIDERFPLDELHKVKRPDAENKDASDTENDREDDEDDDNANDQDDDAGDEDFSGEEGDEDDPEDDPEANGNGGSDDDDDDDDDDGDEDDAEEDGEEEEEEDEDEEEEDEVPQPPSKKRK